MIVEAFIGGIIGIVKFLINSIIFLLGPITIPVKFGQSLAVILSTTAQANNFIHFMIGDTAYIMLPLILALISYKYVVYPVITTILGVFVNKAG